MRTIRPGETLITSATLRNRAPVEPTFAGGARGTSLVAEALRGMFQRLSHIGVFGRRTPA